MVERAGQIVDPELRRVYLHEVADHARVLELADAWASGPASRS
jgi:hypothetical protein